MELKLNRNSSYFQKHHNNDISEYDPQELYGQHMHNNQNDSRG